MVQTKVITDSSVFTALVRELKKNGYAFTSRRILPGDQPVSNNLPLVYSPKYKGKSSRERIERVSKYSITAYTPDAHTVPYLWTVYLYVDTHYYPVYKDKIVQKQVINTIDSVSNTFYDDRIEERLGGQIETLGG